MSAFKRGGLASGGHDHANRQQRRKPERQLVGRNELDDGSGSGPTGRILAIPLITGTTTDFSAKAAGGTSNQLHLRSHRQRQRSNTLPSSAHQVFRPTPLS